MSLKRLGTKELWYREEGTEQCGRRAGLVLRLPHGKRAAKAVLTWEALSCALCLSLPCSEVSVTV